MLHQLLNLQSSSSVQWGGASKECSSSSFCRLPLPPSQLSRGQSPCSRCYILSFRLRGYPPHLVEVAENTEAQSGCQQARAMPGDGAKEEGLNPSPPHRGEVRTEGHLPRAVQSQALPSHCFEDWDLKGSQVGAMSWVPSGRMSSWL